MIELFPYQTIGAEFLADREVSLLADEMGLGKSAQAIRACDLLYAKRVLVVCPAVARANWAAEFQAFGLAKRPTYPVYTSTGFTLPDEGVLILSYDLLEKLYDKLMSVRWDVVIADEAHFLKNRKAKRTTALYGDFGKKIGIITQAKRFFALTGTPAPNDYTELWPMMYAFKATKLKYWDFVNRYTVWRETPFGMQVIKGKNALELKDIMSKFMLRRKKEEVMTQLPPILYSDIAVEPGHVDEELYFFDGTGKVDPDLPVKLQEQQGHMDFMVRNLGLGDPGIEALASAEKSMSTLRRYQGLQKIEPVCQLVDDMIAGGVEKIVIFCIHRDVIETLDIMLKKYKAVTLYGGTPGEKRGSRVKRFQTDPACKVFIGQVTAAGTAITLTAAHHVLFLESSWVPAENAQAAMRCHRIGQTKTVNVKFVSLANSLDQKVQQALKRKTRDLAQLFD